MVIILGMMQVSKKIPFDDPQVLIGVRALYIVSNVIILGIYLYIQQQINRKKGRLQEYNGSAAAPWKSLMKCSRGRSHDVKVRGACADG